MTRRANLVARHPSAVLGLAVMLLAAAIYARVFEHRFLLNWDDLTYVLENETVQRGLTWTGIRAAFGGAYFHNYAPLHILSYAADYSLWGLEPAGFLLTNVALHGANGCGFFVLLLRLGFSPLGAAFAAAVFVAHPVQVESVAWVSERKNVLCMTFSLAALHGYVSYRRPVTGDCWGPYAIALLAAVAALLTKAVAVVLVPVLLLFDICYVARRDRRRWLLDKLPFVAAAAALSVATIASQDGAIAAGREALRMNALTTFYTMVPIVMTYVRMVFWPAGLSALYSSATRESPDAWFWVAALLLIALALIAVLLFSRSRQAFFWYAVFFVGLFPVLHIVPIPTLMNDRYLYFPMLGAAALGGLSVDRIAGRGGVVRTGVIAAAALAVVTLAGGSFARTAVWKDDLSLWTDVTEKTPKSVLGWNWLGVSMVDAGRRPEAIQAFRRAVALDPDYTLSLNNLGAAYNGIGEPARGRPFLLRAAWLAPRDFDAHWNLGLGYSLEGDWASAEGAFAVAVSIRPDSELAAQALRDVRTKLPGR